MTLETAIQVVREHTVATIRLSHPQTRNALNMQMIHELTSLFEAMSLDDDIRIVLFVSDGAVFCAGADLAWMRDSIHLSFEENKLEAVKLAKLFQAIRNCAKPVITRVQGSAYGGGLGLIAASDFVVAKADATFCFSEVKLGLVPAVISPFVLEKAPYALAKRYMMMAEPFSAQQAQDMGLVTAVVDDEAGLDAVIESWTKLLLQHGPEAVAATKHLLHKLGSAPSPLEAEDLTTTVIAERRVSDEAQERMTIFFSK